jgi:hypothetical protein
MRVTSFAYRASAGGGSKISGRLSVDVTRLKVKMCHQRLSGHDSKDLSGLPRDCCNHKQPLTRVGARKIHLDRFDQRHQPP